MKLRTIFYAATVTSPILFGAHLLNNHLDDINGTTLAKPEAQHHTTPAIEAEPTSQEEMKRKKQEFHFNEYGDQRGSIEFAYRRTVEIANPNHLHFYTSAEFARKEGVHPIAVIATVACETGFGKYYGDNKPAQGIIQATPEWLIDLIYGIGNKTKYYAELDNDSDTKATIDKLNSMSFPTSAHRTKLATEIHKAFLRKDGNENSFAKKLSDLRFNNELMVRTLAYERGEANPNLRLENIQHLPSEDVIPMIISQEVDFYGGHNFGDKAYDFAERLGRTPKGDETDYRQIKFSDHNAVQDALDAVASELGYTKSRSAKGWYSHAKNNLGPYGGLPDDMTLGDIPLTLKGYIELKAELFLKPMDAVIHITSPVTGQSFNDFIKTGDDVIEVFYTDIRAPKTSIKPSERPSKLAPKTSKRPPRSPAQA